MQQTNDLRVISTRRLLSPKELKSALPMTERANASVVAGRATVQRILRREDPRLLVVVGPCSIHDPKSALEYAARLATLQPKVNDQLHLVMRVYFEKPRTTIGWKGLINDPHIDGTYDVDSGLRMARKLLLDIAELGLWAAIGARTTESQTHREMASGLSMPVGFKNGTDGSLQIAIDAMLSAKHPHHFLGIDQEGAVAVVRTTGNVEGHVVLRGGRARTNFDATSIADAAAQLKKAGLPDGLMVDCSHANSGKQHARQEDVWVNLVSQRIEGSQPLIGVMIESHLNEGSQPIPADLSQLKYGISLTDACLGWDVTERMLLHGAERLRNARVSTPQPTPAA
jgi:3-deoxy-7-phosphoheptulonate synthase